MAENEQNKSQGAKASEGEAKSSEAKATKSEAKSSEAKTAQEQGLGARGLDEVAKAEAVEKVNGPKVNAEQVKFAKERERGNADRDAKDEEGARKSLASPRLRALDSDDASVGWTAQHSVPLPGVDATPGQVFAVEELPTAEGLRAVGVTDTAAFLAGVPVVKDEKDDLVKERTDSRPGAHPEFKRSTVSVQPKS